MKKLRGTVTMAVMVVVVEVEVMMAVMVSHGGGVSNFRSLPQS